MQSVILRETILPLFVPTHTVDLLFSEVVLNHKLILIIGGAFWPAIWLIEQASLKPGGVLPRILDRGVPRRFLNPDPI